MDATSGDQIYVQFRNDEPSSFTWDGRFHGVQSVVTRWETNWQVAALSEYAARGGRQEYWRVKAESGVFDLRRDVLIGAWYLTRTQGA
jgi:hypothetical protein